MWNKVDNGEVIALDIPYATYAVNQAFYREAFTSAMASVQGRMPYTVYVTNFQTSSAGTTLIFFDTILYGTDYDTVAANAAVHALFNGTDVGCPALPALIAAFNANGLPVNAAYYNDQYALSTWAVSGTPPIAASQIGSWQHSDSGEVIALDVAYGVYATNQQFYKEAFAAAMADALSLPMDAVWVNDFQQSAAGTVLVYFDVALSATSSTAISNTFMDIVGLFSTNAASCAATTPIGCPAGSALVAKLQQYGLPLTGAYYNQQQPATAVRQATPSFSPPVPLE